MTSTRKGVGGLEIWHVFADSTVFKQNLWFLFADVGGECGGHQIGSFLWTS